jgi:hypothetical protein
MITGLIHLVWKFFCNTVVILICAGLVVVSYKANQPMMAAGAPEGLLMSSLSRIESMLQKLWSRLDAVGE